MEGPAAGIAGVEGDGDGLHGRHQHGIPERAREPLAVDRHHLEAVPVQMHGVGHHRHVVQDQLHPLPGAHHQRIALVIRLAVDGPYIFRHVAGEMNFMGAIRLPRCQGLGGDELALQAEVQHRRRLGRLRRHARDRGA
jgi:hypothetical protein